MCNTNGTFYECNICSDITSAISKGRSVNISVLTGELPISETGTENIDDKSTLQRKC